MLSNVNGKDGCCDFRKGYGCLMPISFVIPVVGGLEYICGFGPYEVVMVCLV
ncbi:hypothetical protein HYC85_016704 [Camellia sinensis]|uniref:Uncharacterized protein n=1 Tax=Camellia sinensis TaxID=4442 RepID=A0A7J7H440_CAMSI|nr:hypothetical protein HYC85_016704 [Camellia sinensis]